MEITIEDTCGAMLVRAEHEDSSFFDKEARFWFDTTDDGRLVLWDHVFEDEDGNREKRPIDDLPSVVSEALLDHGFTRVYNHNGRAIVDA